MTKRVQLVRHNTTQADLFIGRVGEISVDTTKNTLRIHNGIKAGGFEAAKFDLSNVPQSVLDTLGLSQSEILANLLPTLQNQSYIWGGTSTGTANAQVITLTPAPAVFVAGTVIRFVPGFTNTDDITINTISLRNRNNEELAPSTIVAGQPTEILYDGTVFRLLGLQVAEIQKVEWLWCGVSTGSVNTYIVDLSKKPAALFAGLGIRFIASFTNNDSTPQINVNSFGNKSLGASNNGLIHAGGIRLDQLVEAVYNGTSFIITNIIVPLYHGPIVASGSSVQFLNIATSASLIRLTLQGLAINGTNNVLMQLGADGVYKTSGYGGACINIGVSDTPNSNGFILDANASAIGSLTGQIELVLHDPALNVWLSIGTLFRGGNTIRSVFGFVTLDGKLDRLKIILSASNVFDAGIVQCRVT